MSILIRNPCAVDTGTAEELQQAQDMCQRLQAGRSESQGWFPGMTPIPGKDAQSPLPYIVVAETPQVTQPATTPAVTVQPGVVAVQPAVTTTPVVGAAPVTSATTTTTATTGITSSAWFIPGLLAAGVAAFYFLGRGK